MNRTNLKTQAVNKGGKLAHGLAKTKLAKALVSADKQV